MPCATRKAFRELARDAGLPFRIVACEAAESVLRERILLRDARGGDASEAGIAVLRVIVGPRAARVFLNRWLRRGVIAGIGTGFALPYFALLNSVRVRGASLLHRLPRRNVVFLSNHQTYFLEAVAFFDLVYVRHQFDFEDPVLRFSAAEETMKKNLFTSLLARAGSVTLRRSFRDAGGDTSRPVDTLGAAKVEKAIRTGWLLHFPAGTTRKGAPLRAGVARILHNTRGGGGAGARRRIPRVAAAPAGAGQAVPGVLDPNSPAARARGVLRGAVRAHRGRPGAAAARNPDRRAAQ